MAFIGENPSAKSLDIESDNGTTVLSVGGVKLFRTAAIVATATPIEQTTGSGLNDFTVARYRGFDVDNTGVYTLTISATGIGDAIVGVTLTSNGPFAAGDTITGNASLASAVLTKYDTDAGAMFFAAGTPGMFVPFTDGLIGNSVVVTEPVGGTYAPGDVLTFSGGNTATVDTYDPATGRLRYTLTSALNPVADAETVSDTTSGAASTVTFGTGTATFAQDNNGYDTYDWSDGIATSGTGAICGITEQLSHAVAVASSQSSGHTISDVFTFTVVGDTVISLATSGLAGTAAMGDILDRLTAAKWNADYIGNVINGDVAPLYARPINTADVVGLDDMTRDTTAANVAPDLVLDYVVEIVNEGTPDQLQWIDGQGGTSGGPVNIPGPGVPLLTSHGITITFAADTGHTAGSTWRFRVERPVINGVVANGADATFTLGDVDNLGNGTSWIVDDVAETLTASKPVVAPNVIAAKVTTPEIRNSAGVLFYDVDGNLLKNSGAVTIFSVEGQFLSDPFGNTVLAFSEANARRFYAANGTEAFNINNTQVNAGLQLRSAAGFQCVTAFQRLYATRTADATLADNSQSIQRIDATAGNVTITLPSASSNNEYNQYLFKRIDSSINTVTIQAPGGQLIDGFSSSITLTAGQARELQSVNNSGTRGWDIIGGYL